MEKLYQNLPSLRFETIPYFGDLNSEAKMHSSVLFALVKKHPQITASKEFLDYVDAKNSTFNIEMILEMAEVNRDVLFWVLFGLYWQQSYSPYQNILQKNFSNILLKTGGSITFEKINWHQVWWGYSQLKIENYISDEHWTELKEKGASFALTLRELKEHQEDEDLICSQWIPIYFWKHRMLEKMKTDEQSQSCVLKNPMTIVWEKERTLPAMKTFLLSLHVNKIKLPPPLKGRIRIFTLAMDVENTSTK